MFRRFFCSSAAILAFVFLTGAPETSKADVLNGQPIYARNNTDNPIWVAAKYVPPGSTNYVTDGWWRVEPGQSLLILYNNGRTIYFHARDNIDTVWDGDDTSAVIRGETVGMMQQDTGPDYDRWTMSFNP